MSKVVNVQEIIGKVLRNDEIVAKVWRQHGKVRLYFNLFGKKFHWLSLTETEGVITDCEAPNFNVYRDLAPERERRQMTREEVHAILIALGETSALVEETADEEEEDDEEAKMIAIALEMGEMGVDGDGWEDLSRQLSDLWKGIVGWDDDRVWAFRARATAAAAKNGWGTVWGIPHLNLPIQREIDYRLAGGDCRTALIVDGRADLPDMI